MNHPFGRERNREHFERGGMLKVLTEEQSDAKVCQWPSKKRRRKMVLCKEPILHLSATERNFSSILTTITITTSADVKTLCRQGRFKEALAILNAMVQRGSHPDSSTYAFLLQGCLDRKALPEAKLLHAHIIQLGFKPGIVLGTKLVSMYVKCGRLVDARRALNQMPKRNVVSWTAMIAAYTRHGHAGEALALFYQMQQTGIQPNQYTFASVLPACANLAALEHGRELHESIIREGFQSDIFVGNALADMYAKCGNIEDARQVFDKMPERDVISWTALIAGYAQNGRVHEALGLLQKMPSPDVASWNAIIAGYVRNGYFDESLKLFRQLQVTGVNPDLVTFASVLPACANLAALQQGKELHVDIIRSGLQSDACVGSALVDMYAKCGSLCYACQVFDKMPRRDVISWTAMIVAYAMHGHGKDALKLFEQMLCSGTKPDRVTFVGVLSACCHAGLVDDGWKYFDSMIQVYHITPAVEHYCCMVDLLGRAGRLEEAKDFIHNMPIEPDAALWASLLCACRIHMNVELGERVAECLFELDPQNSAHYVLLSNIYAAAGRWDGIERVRKMMKDKRVKKTPGCSWIEVNNKVYAFVGGDTSHPQMPKIYEKLESLYGRMKEAGYVADTNFVLYDIEQEQKEHILCQHSEKLAIAFGLMNTSPGTCIRIVKNLRVCGDCHSAIKFMSKIVLREIIVRDASRFHHFKEGQCSCGEYW